MAYSVSASGFSILFSRQRLLTLALQPFMALVANGKAENRPPMEIAVNDSLGS